MIWKPVYSIPEEVVCHCLCRGGRGGLPGGARASDLKGGGGGALEGTCLPGGGGGAGVRLI